MDLTKANQRLVLTLPWAQEALDSAYSPGAPLFFSPDVTSVTLRWAIRRMLRHRIRNKGEGGGWRYEGGGGMGVEAPVGKAPVPRPGTNWGGGFDAGQSHHPPRQTPCPGSLGHQQHHRPQRRRPGRPSQCNGERADRAGRHGDHRTRAGFRGIAVHNSFIIRS